MKKCTCGNEGKFFETTEKDPETGQLVRLIGITCTGVICQRAIFIEKNADVEVNMKRAKEKLEDSWNKAINNAEKKIVNIMEHRERRH